MPLRHDPKNARKHNQRNQEMIKQSLEEVGAFRSIAVDGDGIIRAGNGVYEQAQRLGLKVREVESQPDELIAVVRKDLKGDKAIRAALYDNRTSELAEWDEDILREIAERDKELLEGIIEDVEIPEFDDQKEPEIESEVLIEIHCNNESFSIIRDQLSEWSKIDGIQINVS